MNCPNCAKRNRLREADAAARFRCGNCHTELPNPFAAPAPLKPEPGETFRPSTGNSSRGGKIAFCDTPMDDDFAAPKDLAGVVDAFTGEALNAALGLYQCGKCQLYYHRASYEVIQSENGGKCVGWGCDSVSIRALSQTHTRKATPATSTDRSRKPAPASTFQPDTITLLNYREHVGRVVSFTGSVSKVVKSRSGRDYAIMFEDKDLCDGFKMVIFRGKIGIFGGGPFLKTLAGRIIFARGLLQKHPAFGYQIVVSEPSMFWRIT